MSLRNTLKRIRQGIGKRHNFALLEVLVIATAGAVLGCVVGYYLLF
jgi:membrane protein DedA with SNARE-associated domain